MCESARDNQYYSCASVSDPSNPPNEAFCVSQYYGRYGDNPFANANTTLNSSTGPVSATATALITPTATASCQSQYNACRVRYGLKQFAKLCRMRRAIR